MTYLELVNKVLRRLRENTVSSVTENVYSTLVGEFVNDAKRVVEDAWQWRALHDDMTIPLINGTGSYNLSAYNTTKTSSPPTSRARVQISPTTGDQLLRVIDTSVTPNQYFPGYILNHDYELINRANASVQNSNQRPEKFLIGTAGPRSTWVSGVSTATVYPLVVPRSSNYSLYMYLVNPQEPLSASTDVIAVPYDPVIQLAYLYCLYERGEEVGEGLTLTAAKADSALSDAISLDQTMFYPELIMGPGTT